MLNINELVIIYIISNYQINKRVNNWIVFEFYIFDRFIIRVMFMLTNTIKKHVIDTTHKHELPLLR